ncbi:MAG: hypothetical protein HC862_31395 [Scytonema sp. RU_4_4]|nr:hypothetical protein [Scytonema sp. RU_4_4]
MGRKATGRSTKLIRVPIRFEKQIKELIEWLKEQDKQNNNENLTSLKIDKKLYKSKKNQENE